LLVLLASLLMGVVVYFTAQLLAGYLSDAWLLVRVVSLCALVLTGMAVFAAFTQLSGGSDLLGMLKALTRRNT
jgi:putative peptidoglycan lipid II flippase